MSLNATPASERIHIGIFGKRNAGKSSLINALTGQNLAIVSDVSGTTTDPVYKAMELLPLGPVVLIDTPGIDDEGELGKLRVKKSYQVLNKTDIVLLVCSAVEGITEEEQKLLKQIEKKQIPCILVMNKADLLEECQKGQQFKERAENAASVRGQKIPVLWVSAAKNLQIRELKEKIASGIEQKKPEYPLVEDLLEMGDVAVLVVPIDKAAPKGRLILPQQQTIRGVLEAGATAVVVRDDELCDTLQNLGKKPKLVITDSQVFGKVAKEIPSDVMLTSFSILFARYKGELEVQVRGAKALDHLKNGDKVLICEGCTHHRQCGDIGTEKLPNWIRKHTGQEIEFHFTSGTEFPMDLSEYRMIIHCGGCMLNEREMKYRIACAQDAGIPITNYGVAIAYMNGILKRSVEVFPEIWKTL